MVFFDVNFSLPYPVYVCTGCPESIRTPQILTVTNAYVFLFSFQVIFNLCIEEADKNNKSKILFGLFCFSYKTDQKGFYSIAEAGKITRVLKILWLYLYRVPKKYLDTTKSNISLSVTDILKKISLGKLRFFNFFPFLYKKFCMEICLISNEIFCLPCYGETKISFDRRATPPGATL